MYRDEDIKQVLSFDNLFLGIEKQPENLFMVGRWPEQQGRYLTVVGSRDHSEYGERVVNDLISGLYGYGISVVSGLALGIDGLVHRACIRNEVHTVAVPGSGISPSVIYPRRHIELAGRIVEAGGMIMSPFSIYAEATKYSFVNRNRLMAAMSEAVLVIEAREKSGTLITAQMALEYGKSVLVVPGPINSEYCRGSNRLLSLGAKPVLGVADVLEVYGINEQENLFSVGVTDLEKRILGRLRRGAMTKNQLFDLLSESRDDVLTALATLEIKGVINYSSDKIHIK